MNKLILNKNKNNEKILFLNIVNCDNIKISYYNNKAYDFTEYQLYYVLTTNILKYNYNDDDIKENVYIFTDTEKKKIKNKCLKIFLKAYSKLENTDYKKQKIDLINKYLMEV